MLIPQLAWQSTWIPQLAITADSPSYVPRDSPSYVPRDSPSYVPRDFPSYVPRDSPPCVPRPMSAHSSTRISVATL